MCGVFGSSPRVRGKPKALRATRSGLRIIPARAGQTRRYLGMRARATDHPRACGANCPPSGLVDSEVGSSPRVRGKQEGDFAAASPTRIIPARAGQTVSVLSFTPPRTDHPRACGANLSLKDMLARWAGSSPRVRGKRRRAGAHGVVRRIIPARAGQTRLAY